MLKGQNVVLTEVRPGDQETLYRWINDAETVSWNAPYAPVPWKNHTAWFDGLGMNPSRIFFVVRESVDGPAIGTIQLIDIHRVHRTSELTIRIGSEEHRGRGIGTEALALVVKFAFDDLNLQRVWLRVFLTNHRAIKAYEKAGFEMEGAMRRAAFIQGRWVDEAIMAVLRQAP